MTRRATKKTLRRAEQAFEEQRYADGEELYLELMEGFKFAAPSLLDYAACIFGLIRILYATNRDEQAQSLAHSAYLTLSDANVEVAA
jgi:hypothetical protein